MDGLEKRQDFQAGQSPRRRLTGAALIFLWFASLWLGAAGKAGAQDFGPGPAKVQNVQVNDSFAHSLVVRWDAPLNSGLSSISGYTVAWTASGVSAYSLKLVIPYADKKCAFQVQPLVTNQKYNVAITPIDSLGNLGQTLMLANLSPKGTYEAGLRQSTNNGLNGFLYLPENDPVNGRVNPLKLNNNFFNLHAGDAGGTTFDHSCVAVNNQQHWHMVANDFGTGSITSRIKARIPVDANTRALVWDCDAGPTARQTWYIVLTPNKVEQFLLFPNNGDTQTQYVYPQEQIQIRFDGVNARFLRYSGGNLVGQGSFNWRGAVYTNVRQIMELNINSQGLTGLADTYYNGQLTQTGAFPTDLSTWKSCYAYFTLGSYNNKKTDAAPGISATGQNMLEYQGGNMHWGNVAIVTPDGIAPPTELSYFQQPDIKQRDNALDLTTSPTLTVTIPDAIPADAVSSELVFTDRNGCMPCLSGRNKLRLSVNGTLLPNKQEAAAWADYPTYRWTVPAGVLKKGANMVTFGQNGTPDAIGVSSVHFDIFVPAGSAAIAAYTLPPADPVLDTMPDHTVMEGWTMPSAGTVLPQSLMWGKMYIPAYVNSVSSAHLSGSFIPFDTVWAELDGKTVWTQDTNAAGYGTTAYAGGFWLDTTQYPDGYHSLVVKAHSKSGSVSYNNGSSMYNYDFNYKIAISNVTQNKTKPVIQNVENIDGVTQKATFLRSGDSYFVRRNQAYGWQFDVVSPNLLSRVELWLTYDDGTNHLYRSYGGGTAATTKQTPAGTQYTFSDYQMLYDWWGFSAKGQDPFFITVVDVFGNQATFNYAWSLVPTPASNAGAGQAARVPTVVSFGSDPMVVKKGWACLLSWNTMDAATVTLDNGIGAAAGYGKVCITPAKTTTYTLTAASAKGTVTKSITVLVMP